MNIKKILLILTPLMLVFGCASTSQNTKTTVLTSDDFVIIDRNEAAYTVFVGIPREKLDMVKKQIESDEKATLVMWEMFEKNTDKYVKAQIVKDEYPESKAVPGIVELARKFPGAPFGLTWNGGIALTYNDYKHAKRSYEQYLANPAEYERTRNRDPQLDPVYPQGHLGPLLGW